MLLTKVTNVTPNFMKVTLKQLLLMIKTSITDLNTLRNRTVVSFPSNVDNREEYIKRNTYNFEELYLQREQAKAKLVNAKELSIRNSVEQQVLLMINAELKDEISFLQMLRIPPKIYTIQVPDTNTTIRGYIAVEKQQWYPEIHGETIDQKWVDAKIKELQLLIGYNQSKIDALNLQMEVNLPE